MFQEIAEEFEFEIDTMEVMKDHVHLFLCAPPRYSPARIVQIMKNISAKQVFRRFPYLEDVLWNKELWSDGYFVRTVGDKVTAEVIQRYISYQHRAEQLELISDLMPHSSAVGIFTFKIPTVLYRIRYSQGAG